MAKKISPQSNENEKIDLKVESWQWETRSPRITWRHWLAFAILLTVVIFFAFGFLIIAGVVFIAAMLINIVLFLFRKLT